MMIDYIMRLDALIDACIGCNEEFPNEPCEPNECKIKRALSGIPTADVRENVRGKWNVYEVANTEEEQPIAWECNGCGEVVEAQYNFCPNCGADMRGDNDV